MKNGSRIYLLLMPTWKVIYSNEMLGAQIATLHNLTFYLWLVKTARSKIIDGTFIDWKRSIVNQLEQRL